MKRIPLELTFKSIKGVKEIEQDFMSSGFTLHFDDGRKVEITDIDIVSMKDAVSISKLIEQKLEASK